ncbi:hypothetical protein [Micromonospora chokoriensis]
MSEASLQGSPADVVRPVLSEAEWGVRRPKRRGPGFHLVADLGDMPTLQDVAEYLQDFSAVWSYCLELSILDSDSATGERARSLLAAAERHQLEAPEASSREDEDEDEDLLALNPGDEYFGFMWGKPQPQVRRLSLASPLDALLESTLGHAKWAGYVAGGLITLERLCQLIINWQSHRLDMAERRAALTSDRGPGQVAAELAEELSPHGVRILPRIGSRPNLPDSVSAIADRPLIEGRQITADST